MIYAIDFDGTLARTRFPEILGPNEKMVALVKVLKAQGHKVTLWTSRIGRDLEAAVEWSREQGIEFDAVNEPLPEQISTWGNDTRKIWADVYIDDRAVSVKDAEAMLDAIKAVFTREALQYEADAQGQIKKWMPNSLTE